MVDKIIEDLKKEPEENKPDPKEMVNRLQEASNNVKRLEKWGGTSVPTKPLAPKPIDESLLKATPKQQGSYSEGKKESKPVTKSKPTRVDDLPDVTR